MAFVDAIPLESVEYRLLLRATLRYFSLNGVTSATIPWELYNSNSNHMAKNPQMQQAAIRCIPPIDRRLRVQLSFPLIQSFFAH